MWSLYVERRENWAVRYSWQPHPPLHLSDISTIRALLTIVLISKAPHATPKGKYIQDRSCSLDKYELITKRTWVGSAYHGTFPLCQNRGPRICPPNQQRLTYISRLETHQRCPDQNKWSRLSPKKWHRMKRKGSCAIVKMNISSKALPDVSVPEYVICIHMRCQQIQNALHCVFRVGWWKLPKMSFHSASTTVSPVVTPKGLRALQLCGPVILIVISSHDSPRVNLLKLALGVWETL